MIVRPGRLDGSGRANQTALPGTGRSASWERDGPYPHSAVTSDSLRPRALNPRESVIFIEDAAAELE